MAEQLTSNTEALRLFFTEDIYLISNDLEAPATVIEEAVALKEPDAIYKAEIKYTFLGRNSRNVLILVNDSQHALGTTAGTALLWKIVAAIKLKEEDCAVLNYQSCLGASLSDLKNYFKPQLLLSFGVTPAALGLPAVQTEVLGQQDGLKTIFSAALDALETDISIKKALWKSLQQLTLS